MKKLLSFCRYLSIQIIYLLFLTSLALATKAAQPMEWQSRGIGGGGGTYSPSFSPHNPDELYVSCDMSLMFHTKDLGKSWKTINFHQLIGRISCEVQFTNDPLTLYAIDTTLVKSTDGGQTWKRLPSSPFRASSVFADISNSANVIVCTQSDLYFSKDGGNSFSSKYTTKTKRGFFIAGAFFDGPNIYVGTNDGLFISKDGGEKFSLSDIIGIPSGESIISFAGAKQGGVIRFFAVTANSEDVVSDTFPGKRASLGSNDVNYTSYKNIYTVDVGASQWKVSTNGIDAGDLLIPLSMAKNDISTAYVAGRKKGKTAPVVYKTSDGGKNWKNTFLAENNQNIYTGWVGQGGDTFSNWGPANLPHGLGVSPNDPKKAVFTDSMFIHLTADGGDTWQQLYTDPTIKNPPAQNVITRQHYKGTGLEPTVCWWVNWADPMNLFAGFTDITGVRSKDGGQKWSLDYTGLFLGYGHSYETYQIITHPVNNTLYAAITIGPGELYENFQVEDKKIDNTKGTIKYSTDKGQKWSLMKDFGSPVIWMAIDPNHPNRIYASVAHSKKGGIYVSNDIDKNANAAWNKLADPSRTQGHPFNIHTLKDGTLVCTYSARAEKGNQPLTKSSGVFVSTDEGKTWADRSDPAMQYWTRDLVIDPHEANQDTWYVAVYSGGNDKNGGLYKTSDRGKSWKKIFTANKVRSCTINPTDPNEMWVTTHKDGLWHSNNLRAPDVKFEVDENYPFNSPTRVFYNPYNPNEVWVTSFGNGLYVGTTLASPKTN